MPWYAVQDSDWDWDTTGDDGSDAYIVEAADPTAAARKAAEHWMLGPEKADDVHLKVAELQLKGFIGAEKRDGRVIMDKGFVEVGV